MWRVMSWVTVKVPNARRALGVDHPLGDALAVEVGVLFEQVHVADQQRPARAGGQAVLVVGDRGAVV